ncbi:tetratricopeptide repeat-containing sensor histidine kinase [Epilithonimonas zeae]|uniref:ATP-binding protein n=1 Tax=Epilithonimonas zeae TaxID=1416779 RepID=UPI002010A40D|nr:tetratricopeptide repeat-containing sensor histidine kinase [Epilithonimonas zeae]UQB68583.1 tetratricopeptide repeat-containing sensor histidine kinase [Epilithonimonas zeae]
MIKKLLFFVSFLPLLLSCQEFSKLEFYKQELKKNQSDEKRFQLQQNLVNIYRVYNPDSCFLYTVKNFELIKKNKWYLRKGKSLLGLVGYYAEKNNIKSAFKYNQESFKINTKNNDQYALADNYYMFGRLYHQKGEHAQAVKNYLKSIDIGNKSKNLWIVSSAYRSLAFLYLDESNKEKSYENINKGLKIAKESKSLEASGFCYGVLAEIDRTLGKQKEAQINFIKAYEYFKKTQNEYGQAWLYTNWSLLDTDKLVESYLMQLKAQDIWNKISPNHYMSVVNHYNMAYSYMDFYKQFGKYQKQLQWNKKQLLEKAQKEFETSKNIAEANNNKQWVMFNYLGMSELSMLKRNLDDYAKYTQEYYTTRDSIYSQSRKNEIAKTESRKIVEQKNREIEFNKLIIRNKEKERVYYILGLVALLVIGFLLFYLYKQSKNNNNRLQKLNVELEKANKTKMQFFGILNHDLRSPVISLINFLHLQKEAPEMMDIETKNRLELQTTMVTEQLLEQMEDLLLWSKGQMENFVPSFKNYKVEEIFSDVKREFVWVSDIQMSFNYSENMVVFTDKEYMKTIIRNLINNSIKVLQGKSGAQIICKAWEEKSESLIEISDNGGGANIEKFRALYDDHTSIGITKGLGLHVIRDLCKSINCNIEVKSNQIIGETQIILRIKKA